jgi:hypothetical protein
MLVVEELVQVTFRGQLDRQPSMKAFPKHVFQNMWAYFRSRK